MAQEQRCESPSALSPSGEPRKNQKKLSSGVVALQYVDKHKKEQARRLRRESTIAENILWQHIRNRKVVGLKFRRQQVIEGFIADFYCEEIRLVIEVDGGIHSDPEQKKTDEHREKVFSARGIDTLRLENSNVLNDIKKCLRDISNAANEKRRSLQSPLRAERGGRRPG